VYLRDIPLRTYRRRRDLCADRLPFSLRFVGHEAHTGLLSPCVCGPCCAYSMPPSCTFMMEVMRREALLRAIPRVWEEVREWGLMLLILVCERRRECCAKSLPGFWAGLRVRNRQQRCASSVSRSWEINVNNVPTRLWTRGLRPLLAIPVSLLVDVSYVTRMWEQAHIQGVWPHTGHHPFHCWSTLSCHTSEHFLSGNPRFFKKGQKTLEWSTTFAILTKLNGFENHGFYTF